MLLNSLHTAVHRNALQHEDASAKRGASAWAALRAGRPSLCLWVRAAGLGALGMRDGEASATPRN